MKSRKYEILSHNFENWSQNNGNSSTNEKFLDQQRGSVAWKQQSDQRSGMLGNFCNLCISSRQARLWVSVTLINSCLRDWSCNLLTIQVNESSSTHRTLMYLLKTHYQMRWDNEPITCVCWPDVVRNKTTPK